MFSTYFKLTSKISLTNLHLYTNHGAIKKYSTIYQIMDEYFSVRYEMYEKRKDYQLDELSKGIQLLEAKMRFINYVIDDKIKVYKCPKDTIIESLRSYEFPFYENGCIREYEESKKIKQEYNYLLNLSVYSFTLEKVDELMKEIEDNKQEYQELQETEIKDLWSQELDEFEKMYSRRYN